MTQISLLLTALLAAGHIAAVPCDGTQVEKVGWGTQNSIIQQHAYELSGCDESFVYLLDWENGLWTLDRVHPASSNIVGVDHGLCGINDYYYPEIVNDEMFLDEKWQILKCLELYRGGTRFYGSDKGVSPNIIFHKNHD